MQKVKTYSISFKGGIVSPGFLADILVAAAKAGVKKVRLGLRQQLLIGVRESSQAAFEKTCLTRGVVMEEWHLASPGIMSAYPVIHFNQEDSWLREGVYKDVFDQFEMPTRFKVNIVEFNQSFVPLYTGHINWITTEKPHYWRLALRLPASTTVLYWPEWIYTNNIASVSRAIEEVLLDPALMTRKDCVLFKKLIRRKLDTISYIHIPEENMEHTARFYLPYYEGFNKVDSSYWLGIYRRDEYFDLEFLREICELCQQTKIAEMYTTPWKSLIIKDIDPASRPLWDRILGKYRVNVRHAANELNWQIEDQSEEGLSIKRAVIRHFDKEDVRTYGLCFGVQIKSHSTLFASVLIKKKVVRNPHRLKSLERYDILHTADFNPNTQQWVLFREDVKKEFIGTYLVSLCKEFYSRPVPQQAVQSGNNMPKETQDIKAQKLVYQCSACLSAYDPELGDTAAGIYPGTGWEQLPSGYCCSVCGAEKTAFNPIHLGVLQYIDG